MPRYWLFKSNPSTFSFDDLVNHKKTGITDWNLVRNSEAQGRLRDQIERGDGVLIYHSSTNPLAVVGTAVVVREAYPDPDDPKWSVVDIRAWERLSQPVTLESIRVTPTLAGMELLHRDQLSVQSISVHEWRIIREMGCAEPLS